MENLINITETTILNSTTVLEIANHFNLSLFEVELIMSESETGKIGDEVELEDGLNYAVFEILDNCSNLPEWKIKVIHLDFFS